MSQEIKERPILFSGPMVRAILEGRKTVTRRAIKLQPDVPVTDAIPRRDYPHGPATIDWYWRPRHGHLNGVPSHGWYFKCPYGQPGDRLWVRESFADLRGTGIEHRPDPAGLLSRYAFAADSPPGSLSDETRKDFGVKWKPSIHMPRIACRILLKITAVRVERLQDISDDQAIAEGIERDSANPTLWRRGQLHGDQNIVQMTGFPKLAFRSIWEAIKGHESWAANPWVWVIEFKLVMP